jgi:hypothetical protein
VTRSQVSPAVAIGKLELLSSRMDVDHEITAARGGCLQDDVLVSNDFPSIAQSGAILATTHRTPKMSALERGIKNPTGQAGRLRGI